MKFQRARSAPFQLLISLFLCLPGFLLHLCKILNYHGNISFYNRILTRKSLVTVGMNWKYKDKQKESCALVGSRTATLISHLCAYESSKRITFYGPVTRLCVVQNFLLHNRILACKSLVMLGIKPKYMDKEKETVLLLGVGSDLLVHIYMHLSHTRELLKHKLKWGDRSDTFLTHVYRLSRSVES